MTKQTYEQTSKNKINKWLQTSTRKDLLQDMDTLNRRQFNKIYGEHYSSQYNFEGTLRRIRQYLIVTEIHKPSKNVYHYKLPKRELKNAWKLKGGKKGISKQQVLIRVEYLKKEYITLTHNWITFSSGLSPNQSLHQLYKYAMDRFDKWLFLVRSKYKTYVKIYDVIVRVNRFLK